MVSKLASRSAPDPGKRPQCDACRLLMGIRTPWHAHPNLSQPGSPATSGYKAQTFQKLYACKECRSILVFGRNTGWAQAVREAAGAGVSKDIAPASGPAVEGS